MPSVREALEEATALAEQPVVETQAEAPVVETVVEEKPGRTAGRPRDEKGRLLPKDAAAPQDKTALPAAPDAPTAPAAAAAPEKVRPQRPSSWKKDYWDHWEKLDPNLAEYLSQRESEFAKGVSTYKTEYDRLKPFGEVVQQYLPVLQQHGLDPVQHVDSLLRAHQTLALAQPQEKAAMFVKLAQQYQVPLESLFTRGQDGQIYLNQNLPQPQQQQPRQSTEQQIEQLLDQREMQREIKAASQDKTKYPHFDEVRETMAGLLQSGLADDLPSAYDAALRHPRHADLWNAMQQQQRAADEKAQAEARRKATEQAKRNAFSTKTASPTGTVAATGAKGVRGAIESAFDQHADGRV